MEYPSCGEGSNILLANGVLGGYDQGIAIAILRMVSYSRRPKSGQITYYLNRTYHVHDSASFWTRQRQPIALLLQPTKNSHSARELDARVRPPGSEKGERNYGGHTAKSANHR